MNDQRVEVLEVVKRYTRTFLTVARERSFLKAAQKLHITQSAVSQKMSALEASLGVKLFDRSTRPLSFTTQAKYLMQILQKQEAELTETIQNIQLNSHCLPVIRFGMIESMTDCIGLPLIQSLTTQTHKVVHIVGTADALLSRLRKDEVELIITSGDLSNEQDLQKIDIFYDPLIAVIPNSLLSKQKHWTLSELMQSGLPFIRSPSNSGSGASINRFLEQNHLNIPNQYEIDTNTLQLKMVANNRGWTITYATACANQDYYATSLNFQCISDLGRTITIAAKYSVSPTLMTLMAKECCNILKNQTIPKILKTIPSCKDKVRILDV